METIFLEATYTVFIFIVILEHFILVPGHNTQHSVLLYTLYILCDRSYIVTAACKIATQIEQLPVCGPFADNRPFMGLENELSARRKR